MQISYTREQEELRRELRSYFSGLMTPERREALSSNQGEYGTGNVYRETVAQMGHDGWLALGWPEEYGGQARSAMDQLIFTDEAAIAGAPVPFLTINSVAPTIMAFGTDEQKKFYLPRIAAGDLHFAIGYSEPGAGTDLAALRTTAVRDGDDYVINGSKIWTSYAAMAQHCFLLARTGEASSGKAGIAIFLVPMSTPGIEVRPIPSLIGHGDIHETFFTDVRVPVSARLGEEGQAWSIISYSLANERIGIPRYEFAARVLDRMVEVLHARQAFSDPLIQVRAAAASAACEAARLLVYRAVDKRARGEAVGAEASIARVAVAEADNAVTDFGLDFLPDTFAGLDHPAHLAHHERAIVTSIAAGAAEIQLGLIARNWLELPREAS